MQFASFTVILLSAIVVASSALGGGAEGAEGNDADKSSSTNSQLQQQHQQRRELLSSWCPLSTPVLWHRDLTKTWSAGTCINVADCDSPGFQTQLECCKGAFAGQTSNACLKGLPNPPTPLPTSLSTKSPSHLPTSTPTKSPTAINPNQGKWYADYGTVWINAGCRNTLPHPNYATHYFESQEECCNFAYAGQTSGACLNGLRSKSPIMPTTNIPSASPVTSKPTSSEPTSSPSTNTPTASPVTSKPTSSKPTLEPISPTSIPTTGKPSQIPTSKPTSSEPSKRPTTSNPTFTSSEPSKSPTTSNPTLIPIEAPYTKPPATDFPTTATDFPTGEVAQITDAAMVVDDDDILVKDVM